MFGVIEGFGFRVAFQGDQGVELVVETLNLEP